MRRPRVLIILNRGRAQVLAARLAALEAEGIIGTWAGISLVPLADLGAGLANRHPGRFTSLRDLPRRFRTYAEAAEFAGELARLHPTIPFGRIYGAEKYPGRTYPGGLPDMMSAFAGIIALKEEMALDTVFSDYPASAADLMAYHLFMAAGGKAFYFVQSRVGNKLDCVDSLERAKPEVVLLYRKYVCRALTPDERFRAEAFLAEFRARKAKPSYYVHHFRHKPLTERLSTFLAAPAARVRALAQRARAAAARRGVRFHCVDPRDRIVFLPIQYVPEASVYVRAPAYRDQAALVSRLAMSLPAGYTLYVKDHPLQARERDAAYYRRLLEFPNVKLLDYGVNTHDVLRAARLTVTLSGTPGLESLLYGVPVLLLGSADTAYQDFQGVCRLGRASLEEGLLRGLELVVDPSGISAMALAFLDSGMPGKFNDPHWDPEVLSPENEARLHAFFTWGFERLAREFEGETERAGEPEKPRARSRGPGPRVPGA